MSIFGTIINKLFGKANATATADTATAGSATPTVVAPSDATNDAAPAAPPTVAPLSGVDVAVVMDRFVSESGQTLDWRVSIVDMMKALGMDSSLDHRKQLAGELGYTGDTNDSASMNIWLHKEVMKALAANGGTLPANLAA
ncbi:DUF3597 domain-containing protein [Dyella japonica]|uniref:DUF3597 domain-containing protein n=1 Tax=Dyella japonica A8 TaxID=1217721 RepID=A0A075K5U7_9GAMM|nr:DUF3597 domain-containing protein [Dyella japonica]AIF49520.1 hypothetical protein HY57_20765 [Dyella japonica A8]